MTTEKRRLKQEYKQSERAIGVFVIRNTVNGKVFVGTGQNLTGIINRHKFELTMGGHPNKRLQAEWNEFGGERFVFEIVDQLKPAADSQAEARADLKFLEELWLDKLQPFDERGYNKRKPGE